VSRPVRHRQGREDHVGVGRRSGRLAQAVRARRRQAARSRARGFLRWHGVLQVEAARARRSIIGWGRGWGRRSDQPCSRRPPHGHGCRRSGQTASDRQTSTAGRRFQGLQPARAAGGLKNDYPGKCGAFLQGTPVHFKVQGLRTSRWMRHAPQTRLGFAWVLQVPDAPVGRAPLPPGGTGPSSRIGCCASMRGDKAHGRLEGGRRWLGYVMTPHSGGVHRRQGCTSAAQATSKGPMNGSTGKWLHRGLRGTARELLEVLQRSRGGCGSRPLTAA
jgi:hypothetical protein